MHEPIFLGVKWSVSKGRETYGYNICTLTDTSTGKRFRCNGGGYDMLGTVFGEWLQETHPEPLKGIADKAYFIQVQGITDDRQQHANGFYGMRAIFRTHPTQTVRVSLDGACGIESMRRIAEAIGLHTRSVNNRKGQTIGYIVTEGNQVNTYEAVWCGGVTTDDDGNNPRDVEWWVIWTNGDASNSDHYDTRADAEAHISQLVTEGEQS